MNTNGIAYGELMSNKIGLIYQPCGLGDILFLQKIAWHMKNLGYEVYWPVVHELKWLNDYIKDFHFISWDDVNTKLSGPPLPDHVTFPFKEYYLPNNVTSITDELFFFQGFLNVKPIMAGKYDSVKIDWSDWRDYILFERNIDKENELYYNVLKLLDDEPYTLVNKSYGTRPRIFKSDKLNNLKSKIKTIDMQVIEGFSLFDWYKVIENAKEIYMIETSLNYLMESPQLFDIVKNKELYLYHRFDDFTHVQYLFNLPWKYMQ